MAEQPQEIVLVHLEYLRERMDGVIERLDTQNGSIQRHATAIAILQDRAEDAKHAGAKWGTAAGAGVAALVAGLWQMLGGGK